MERHPKVERDRCERVEDAVDASSVKSSPRPLCTERSFRLILRSARHAMGTGLQI